MNGTFHSTSGLWRITHLARTFKLRLAVFVVGVATGAAVLFWIQIGVGREMAGLQDEFGKIKAQRFYVAAHLRYHARELNEALLRYHLDHEAADREVFRTEAQAFKERLRRNESLLSTRQEHDLFTQIRAAYDRVLADAERLFSVDEGRPNRAAFADAYEHLQNSTTPLLELITQLMQVQQKEFDQFMFDSLRTLRSLQGLIQFSLLMVLLSALVLTVLVYRGMIAPLRERLSESQAIIERQEKLAALGTLAAGVAHEIRNPLTAIKFRLFSLKKSLPPALAENEDASVISAEINRLDRIVKDFLQFARPAAPQLVGVLAERMLEEIRDLMQGALQKSGIQLKLETEGTHEIHVDISQLKQVLINLIQNAADSIGRNGTIRLRATQEIAALGGRSRPATVLQVSDTGKGIPPELQKRIFDPFFTTKEGGTGLGLAIAARIVEKHGGLLRYQTELNRGTTFDIVLPRLDDDASPTPHHRR